MNNIIDIRKKLKKNCQLSEHDQQNSEIVRGLRNTSDVLGDTHSSMKQLTSGLSSTIKTFHDAEQALRRGNERRRRMMETIESIEVHGLQDPHKRR